MEQLEAKKQKLQDLIRSFGRVLIAFSGGVDSTYLLYISKQILGPENVLAVIAQSPTYPKEEVEEAITLAGRLEAPCRIIDTEEFQDENFVSNPADRCYFCKKELFLKLKDIARKHKIRFIIDASNVSDKKDFRPGARAKIELSVRSPLAEAGFTKDDIRRSSRAMGLNTWDKPALACLASRIPYGTRIAPGLLKRVEKAEDYLAGLGFRQVRVRHYDGLCRIEVPDADIPRLINKRGKIFAKLKKLGYNYVTADLQGYRTGSMNEVIK